MLWGTKKRGSGHGMRKAPGTPRAPNHLLVACSRCASPERFVLPVALLWTARPRLLRAPGPFVRLRTAALPQKFQETFRIGDGGPWSNRSFILCCHFTDGRKHHDLPFSISER